MSVINTGGIVSAVKNVGGIAEPAKNTASGFFPEPAAWNIVVFIWDDVGVERLSYYGTGEGNPYARTPVTAQWAADGILFTRAYAHSLCGTTRASVQTGRLPHRTGFGTNVPLNQSATGHLDPSEKILGEIVRDARPAAVYQRSMFGKYHLVPDQGVTADEQHPGTHGYARYIGSIGNIGSAISMGNIDHFHWRKTNTTLTTTSSTLVNGPPYDETTWSASVHRADFLSWLSVQTKPFISFINFNAPHEPYTTPPFTCLSVDTQNELSALGIAAGDVRTPGVDPDNEVQLVYRAAIEGTDTEFGRCITGMPADKRANTLVIVIGDNGTPANIVQPPYVANHGKRTAYEQGIRVPMIVKGPANLVVSPGRECAHLVHAIDVFATILDVMRGNQSLAIPGVTTDSVSFRPYLQVPDAAARRSDIFCQVFNPSGPSGTPRIRDIRSLVRADGYKYIYKFGDPDTVEELYDVLADPREENNLLLAPTDEDTAAFVALKARVASLLGSWS